MIKNKIIYFVILFGILIFVIGGVFLIKNKKTAVIQLNFNDTLSNVKVKNSNNEITLFPNSDCEYQIIFYLDTKCRSCIEQLETVRMLNSILITDNTDIRVLWEDKMDKGLIQEYRIPVEDNYVMFNGKLDVVTPTGILADAKNNVIFATFDFQKLFYKYLLLGGVDQQVVLENANRFLLNEAADVVSAYYEDKEVLLYFATEGCLGCEQADQIVYSTKVKERFNVLPIWSSKTADNYSGIKDAGNILSNVYEIDHFPRFIRLTRNNMEVIDDVEVNDLERELLEN